MTEDIIILKLGGSVITDKFSKGIINYQVISTLSSLLSGIKKKIVLIHGAGSLGHPEAKKWNIVNGITPQNIPGICETHEAVSKLNSALVKMLRDDGVNAISFPPFAGAYAENRRLVYGGERQIHVLLNAGVMPVLFGDTVLDGKQGICIISGDQLVQYLARELNASSVGVITFTGGVLDENGKIIPEITPDTLDSVPFRTSDSPDITGGMKGKVDELLTLAQAGIPSQIFGPQELLAFFEGKNPGTRISGGH